MFEHFVCVDYDSVRHLSSETRRIWPSKQLLSTYRFEAIGTYNEIRDNIRFPGYPHCWGLEFDVRDWAVELDLDS